MMEIGLCTYSIVQSELTWRQLQDALTKAEKSEANRHFMFYYREMPNRNGAVAGCDLLAMPREAYDAFLSNPKDFVVTIEDHDQQGI